jgi:signal transduction histidine kinase
VLLLRDVLARSLFAKYDCNTAVLDSVLDVYEPAANRIATTVAVGFVEERDRIRYVNVALRRINERLEAEVRRIARALHDEAGPLLVSVHLALKETVRDVPPAARQQLADVAERLNQVEDKLRHLSHELRPPMLDEEGLVPALRFLADGVAARRGLAIALQNRIGARLPSLVETAVYRVVQEGLANVCRHAKASQAWVSLFSEGGELHCIVRDDGVGMKAAARRSAGRRGLGLVGMQERLVALGGTLGVSSRPGHGTELHARLPLEV